MNILVRTSNFRWFTHTNVLHFLADKRKHSIYHEFECKQTNFHPNWIGSAKINPKRNLAIRIQSMDSLVSINAMSFGRTYRLFAFLSKYFPTKLCSCLNCLTRGKSISTNVTVCCIECVQVMTKQNKCRWAEMWHLQRSYCASIVPTWSCVHWTAFGIFSPNCVHTKCFRSQLEIYGNSFESFVLKLND